jgi:hypothetical protein
MASTPHLFEDLCLINNKRQVNGIGDGLETKGKGTFIISIKDNKGRVHTIKIPNSHTRIKIMHPVATALGTGGRRWANLDLEF